MFSFGTAMTRLSFSRLIAFAALAFAASFTLGQAPATAQSIGTTITTKNVVIGDPPRLRQHRKKSDDPIVRNEVIETRAESVGQFEFSDGTAFVVGPNSRFTLNTAIFGGDRHSELVTGALRFVTDRAAPRRDLVVTTPVATVGIRGTVFDLFVEADGTSSVLLVRGGPVELCNRGGSGCIVITEVCDAAQIGPGGRQGPSAWDDLFEDPEAAGLFPFSANAHRTRARFRRGVADCGIRAGFNLVPPLEERLDTGNRDEDDDDDVNADDYGGQDQ